MSNIYNTHRPAAGEGSNLYLKIQDGQTVKLRLASEPAIFETEGDRDGEKTISTRYGWLVWNQDLKQPQILQMGARFFKDLAALAQDEEWGDPTAYDIKISRKGSGFSDTTYNVVPSANREALDSEATEMLRAIDLIEKLNASPFSQRVMWLSDWDNLDRGQDDTKPSADPEPVADDLQPAKKDNVAEVVDDDPIDLSDIPF